MSRLYSDIELLAPAGSFDTALAAFAAGADAVYLGLDAFSARAQAVNFSQTELANILAYAHAQQPPCKVYVTFNVVVDEAQLPEAVERLAILDELQPDGVIVQDLGVARLAHRHFPNLVLHGSTQLAVHNLEGVRTLRELGFTRVVPARELSLADIRALVRCSGLEIEVFVHGALCYSISGLCLFSAMTRSRSGNRGQCAYCCRTRYADSSGETSLPFSMRDLRLDNDLNAIREAGVVSLKIEGRMKSALYVASVVKRYRELLDGVPASVSQADLETVFSRRTTSLYLHGYDAKAEALIDATSLGHLGTEIGVVKRITRDREGRAWLRFHTTRALERHDGLQFSTASADRPVGMGIDEMRLALSRHVVFEVPAQSDVEIRISDPKLIETIQPGMTVFCSSSNAVARRFPIPPYRPSDYSAGIAVDLKVSLSSEGVTVKASAWDVSLSVPFACMPARNPNGTVIALQRAFEKLGSTIWRLGNLTLEAGASLFAPASVLNDLRRKLVLVLDEARRVKRTDMLTRILEKAPAIPAAYPPVFRSVKIRLGQQVPEGEWDEIVVVLGHADASLEQENVQMLKDENTSLRLALPILTKEADFPHLRARVRSLIRLGYVKWEACDLAGLKLLRDTHVTDITTDWSLYAFNHESMRFLADWGVHSFVCSPENTHENLKALAHLASADSTLPRPVFLVRQSTPLFISFTRPLVNDPSLLQPVQRMAKHEARSSTITSFCRDGFWITTETEPQRFAVPAGSTRADYSWDA